MEFQAKRSQTIQVVVNNTITGANSDIPFDNEPQLQSISGGRQVFVEAIEVHTNEDLAFSPSTANLPVANTVGLQNAVLTLSVDTNFNFKKIPLSSFHRTFSTGVGGTAPNVRDLFRLNQIWQIDWSKSFITVVQAPVAPPFCYLFTVYYRYSTDVEPIEQGMMQTEILNLGARIQTIENILRGNQ